MNKKKIYLALFGICYAPLCAAVVALSLWLEPFEGDLTRTGRLAENNYGWQHPQKRFPKDTTQYAELSNEDYSGKQDVLVFGDSFSHFSMLGEARTFGWQLLLQESSDHTVFTYHLQNKNIDQWLENTPPEQWPDYIVYQEVERTLKERPLPTEVCESPRFPPLTLEYDAIPFPATMIEYQRQPRALVEVNAAIHWLRGRFNPKQKAVILDLERDDLFSNRYSSQTLIMPHAIKYNRRMPPGRVEQVACYLGNLKHKAESNGRTRMIIAVTPDKYTLYAPYAVNLPTPAINLVEELNKQGLPVFRYDQVLASEIQAGTVDVYLPNDTHWGAEGSRVFASAILSQM